MMKFGLCNDDFNNANKTLGFCSEKRPDLVALSMRGGALKAARWDGDGQSPPACKELFLAMADLGTHFSLLAANFSSPFTGFLRSH